MSQVIFLSDYKELIHKAYTVNQIDNNPILNGQELKEQIVDTQDTEYIFSTWGMPALTEEEIKRYLPKLKAVFYAAGTVQSFARAFLNCNIRVFSAWAANAIPVAEFTVAQIILANKGYFQLHNLYRQEYKKAISYAQTFDGNYGTNVGLIGAGMIGKKVIELLKPYNLNIKVFDPFLDETQAELLGVEKVSLEELFSTCQTISNHLANNEKTKGMLHKGYFDLMKDNATFINTGRGAQVVLEDLRGALIKEPNRTALLDVTDPTEPLPVEHPLWRLPNVFLTPHRAGSTNSEILRMGEYMIKEYHKVLKDEEVLYEVNLKMLETMA